MPVSPAPTPPTASSPAASSNAVCALCNSSTKAGTTTAKSPPACATTPTLSACNQLGRYDINQEVRGWGLHDTWQLQFTATKTFANVLKASQAVLVTFRGALAEAITRAVAEAAAEGTPAGPPD